MTRDGTLSPAADFMLDRSFLDGLDRHLSVPQHVAIVGAGRWARVLCNVLTEFSPPVPRITLVAERNYAAVQQWVEERSRERIGYRRVAVSRSLTEVLAPGGADVAFVTKMAAEHYAAARQLLLAGKHVLVEKPFVLSAPEAEDLVRLAGEQARTLAVGYEFMFARAFHHFRDLIADHLEDVAAVEIQWDDCAGAERWGVPKQPDLSANVVTDLYPHVLSQLFVLFGRQNVSLRAVTSRDGCWNALIDLVYGSIPATLRLDKHATAPRRLIQVTSSGGRRLTLDFTNEPGHVELDGRPLPPDAQAQSFPRSLTSEIAYFFAQTERPAMTVPNAAERTLHFVEATDRANAELVAAQTAEVRPWLWQDLPARLPGNVMAILRHHLVAPLLRHGVIASPKDPGPLDRWVDCAFRIAHRFSRDPWAEQQSLLESEGLTTDQLVRLNAAVRDSEFLQHLIVKQGMARKYWSTIQPLIETSAVQAVLGNTYQFPLRLGIYAAVSCMFSCTFCGRMGNPGARYEYGDVAPGNELFDAIFSAMPRGISTLSLGGGLEPLTNPKLDDVIWSAKRHGHKVPLVTNGFMLTPVYVKRHEGLWDVDVLRISLYGVDEQSYRRVTQKPGAFAIVKSNVIELLKERRRRGRGPRVGFNFIVLVNTTGQVLRILDLVREINEAVGAPAVDFVTLREDFSIGEGEGLTADERRGLVGVFREFNARRKQECPELSVDFGYALHPLSEGIVWKGLAMVAHRGMLPRAYPQVSVALDLLGDVYLYRDAAFPGRPGADRYIIGRVTNTRSLEMVVRDFIESGREIPPLPRDPALMDAFDHVVTKLIWQAQADQRCGIPLALGPVRHRIRGHDGAAAGAATVNYWQALFGV